jgi:hypothetical protein
VSDLIDSPADVDDWLERRVITRLPARPPVDDVAPLSAAVRYPPGPVPDLEDAPVRVGGREVRQRRQLVWIRSRVTAGLLGVFLGGLGLHRMYLGYWRRGLTMLAIFVVGGVLTLGLASLVVGLWGFAEGLLYLSVRRGRFARDAHGRPLRG